MTALERTLRNEGYLMLREINGVMCAVHQMMYTTAIMVGCNESGYSHRYCYEHATEALAALMEWNDTNEQPPGNWIVRKGVSGDYYNPNHINHAKVTP